MSTISSVHETTRDMWDAALVVVGLVLVIVLMAAGPHAGEALSSFSRAVTAWSDQTADTSFAVGHTAVFAADQRYWEANCSHGWSGDATCAEIAQRVQSCRISLDSAYCSAYDSYLQSFSK